MRPNDDQKIDRIFIFTLFGVALAAHFYLTTINWTWGFMTGHEFRQAQTAIISYYIDRENNFSVHYETPIMGKPWEIPLEFPFYEWCVVWLSRATGWPHFISARTLSLTSFYASLPAIFMLLGQVGMSRRRRLVVIALVLMTPVYIFYSRAFLIDPMAFMFSVWFLALFVETMRRRRWGWLVVCTLCATAAGLIKSLVLFAWIFPAALYGAYCLWRDIAAKAGKVAIAKTLGWGLGAVVVPVIALSWWVRMTDAIKEKHASAYIFTSQNLSEGNYGTFRLSSRTAPDMWKDLFARWREAITEPWIIGVIVLIGLVFFPRERLRILGATVLFLAAQLLIPYAYAWQDYYFYICAAFIIFAFGFVLNGVLDSGLPRAGRWILVLLPFVALLNAHRQYYLELQNVRSHGGTGLTIALRDYLPKDTVLVVAGADWAAIIPYYSKHRALMIRNGLEHDAAYLERAFKDLADEKVGALVLVQNQRGNRSLVERAAAHFNVDSQITFSHPTADVYVNRSIRPIVLSRLKIPPLPEGIIAQIQEADLVPGKNEVMLVTPEQGAALFSLASPAPWKCRFSQGYELWEWEGQSVLNAHPETDLWLSPPAGAKEIVFEFAIRRDAYERPDKTDGALFLVEAETPGGETRTIFSRYLNPAAVPGDRGVQRELIPFEAAPGESIVFRTRGPGSDAFDWCYFTRVQVR